MSNAQNNSYRLYLNRKQKMFLATQLPAFYSFQSIYTAHSVDADSIKSQVIKKKKLLKDPDYNVGKAIDIPLPKIQSNPTIPGGEAFVQCYAILKKLKKSQYSWPFRIPVDPKALGIPEYFQIINEPMDLRTIEQNLRKEVYKHAAQFHRDIYKILMNSYKFNQKNSEVYLHTLDFQEYYLQILKEFKDKQKIQPSNNAEPVSDQNDNISKEPTPSLQNLKIFKKQKKQKKEKIKEMEKSQKIEVKMIKQQHMQAVEFQKIQLKNQRQKQKQKQKAKKKSQKTQKAQRIFTVQIEDRSIMQQYNFKIQQKEKEKTQKVAKENREAKEGKQQKEWREQKKLKQSKQAREKSQMIARSEQKDSFKQLKQIKDAVVQNQKNIIINQIQKKLSDLLKRLNEFQIPKNKQKNYTKALDNLNQHPNLLNFSSMTLGQKKKLTQKIMQLPSQDLKYIIEIVYRNKMNRLKDEEGAYQIDLEKIDPKMLKQITNFIIMRTKVTFKKLRKHHQASSHQSASQEPSQHQIENYQIAQQLLNHEIDIQQNYHAADLLNQDILNDDFFQERNIFNHPEAQIGQLEDLGNSDNDDEPQYEPEEDDSANMNL